MRMKSDLVSLCEAAIEGNLNQAGVIWDERPALGVVLAAGGYPEFYQKGDVVTGLDEIKGDSVKVFHAGTANNDNIVTNGGRVLCVTALGEDIADAQKEAYAAVEKIHWQNMYCRRDIGYRAVNRFD